MLYLLLIAVFGNLITMTFKSYRAIIGVIAPALVMSLSLIMVSLMMFSEVAFVIAIYFNLGLFLFSVFVIIRALQIKAEGTVDDFTEFWEWEDNNCIPVRDRLLVSKVTKMVVWQRDKGRCVACGSIQNLEFNYIDPCTKGGSGIVENIQLLCKNCFAKSRK